MTHFARHSLPISILLAAACGGRDAQDTYDVRDSAGITIHENLAGQWSEATAWTLSSDPVLTIGTLDGPEEYQLFRVRAAVRIGTGDIVVANGGTSELRFYDSNGAHLRTVGREGGGPGEFKGMGGAWRLGNDSIVVSDFGNARLAVFDSHGELGRTFRLDQVPDAGRAVPVSVFADGSFLLSAIARPPGEPQQGLRRDSILYVRQSATGELLEELVKRPGRERLIAQLEGNRIAIMSAPYGPTPSAAAAGARWFYGFGKRYEIEVYAVDGTLTHLYRRAKENRPITAEIAEAYRERMSGSNMPPAFARLRAGMGLPETMPAFGRIVTSDNGGLWVQNYTLPDEQPSWAVFRDDGRYLGDVDTPMSARVLHIGDDFVLVSWEDELEVEYVQMYELIMP